MRALTPHRDLAEQLSRSLGRQSILSPLFEADLGRAEFYANAVERSARDLPGLSGEVIRCGAQMLRLRIAAAGCGPALTSFGLAWATACFNFTARLPQPPRRLTLRGAP